MNSEEVQQLETRLMGAIQGLKDEMHLMDERLNGSITALSERVANVEGKLDSMKLFLGIIGGMMAAILAAIMQVAIRHIF